MIKIGICSSHTDRDRLANIAKSGADYVEFCLNAFENCEKERVKETAAMLKDWKLPVRAYNGMFPWKGLRVTGKEMDVERIKDYLEDVLSATDVFGAPYVVFGSSGARKMLEGDDRGRAQADLFRLFEECIIPAFERHNRILVIEPLNTKEDNLINTVFDGNTYKEFGGQIFNTHEGVNWYTSIVNAKLDDPFYMHGQGLGGTAQGQTNWGHWQFLLLHGLRPLSSMAFLFKGNNLNGGSYMQVNSNYNYCRDFVIEKNHFGENAKCGVYFNGGSDGVYLRGNTFDSDVCYDSTLISNLNTQNEVVNILGDYRYKSEDDYLRTGGTKMGDVNGDGKINIKDVTYIRYYILGKIELSNAQIARADMDGDGEITTNDANKLRKLILGL